MHDTAALGEVSAIAQNLARNCGWRVFPCRDNKQPACRHGFKDAVNDPNAVADLWRKFPGPLIGVATGGTSGFDCLDLDVKHGAARDWWQCNEARVPATRTYRTRSGGLHLYFVHHAGITCSAGAGIDVRGDNGYVIFWFATGLACLDPSPAASWPTWLLDPLLQKAAPRPVERFIPPCELGRSIKGPLRLIATAPEGQRNTTLHWAACRLGEEVAAGHLKAGEAEGLLVAAALASGLNEAEALKTARSGLRRTA